MLGKLVLWFGKAPNQSPEEIERLLNNRTSAEIAARLLRRAELHGNSDDYHRRCAVLDRVAAEQIRKLESMTSADLGAWDDRRDMCLRLLREGTN